MFLSRLCNVLYSNFKQNPLFVSYLLSFKDLSRFCCLTLYIRNDAIRCILLSKKNVPKFQRSLFFVIIVKVNTTEYKSYVLKLYLMLRYVHKFINYNVKTKHHIATVETQILIRLIYHYAMIILRVINHIF